MYFTLCDFSFTKAVMTGRGKREAGVSEKGVVVGEEDEEKGEEELT